MKWSLGVSDCCKSQTPKPSTHIPKPEALNPKPKTLQRPATLNPRETHRAPSGRSPGLEFLEDSKALFGGFRVRSLWVVGLGLRKGKRAKYPQLKEYTRNPEPHKISGNSKPTAFYEGVGLSEARDADLFGQVCRCLCCLLALCPENPIPLNYGIYLKL